MKNAAYGMEVVSMAGKSYHSRHVVARVCNGGERVVAWENFVHAYLSSGAGALEMVVR